MPVSTMQMTYSVLTLNPKEKPPGPKARRFDCRSGSVLDARADRVQDPRDLAAQEEEGDDRDDRDEGEDQRVLRETLAFLVPAKRGEKSGEQRH